MQVPHLARAAWHWTRGLRRVFVLCVFYIVCVVGVRKVPTLFFSWLSHQLTQLPLLALFAAVKSRGLVGWSSLASNRSPGDFRPLPRAEAAAAPALAADGDGAARMHAPPLAGMQRLASPRTPTDFAPESH